MPVCRLLFCVGSVLIAGLALATVVHLPVQAQVERDTGQLLAAIELEKLKLNGEQKEKYAKIDLEFQDKQKELGGKLQTAKMNRDRAKYMEANQALQKLRPESLGKLEAILTDSQKAALKEIRSQGPRQAPQKKKDQPRRPKEPDLKVGDLAPDFTIQDVEGKQTVKLSELRGKPTVLIFGSCT